jgi:hypothetical protein
VRLRIPGWVEGASVSVNGKREVATPGTFATLRRAWKTGDQIDLELPLKNRVEPLDAAHANTVALLNGPLVLFPIADDASPITRQQLLAAKKTGEQSWQVETATARRKLLPFTAIADEPYSTYMFVG